MAYTPVTFVDGVTPLNAAKMNQLEDGVESAHVIADAAIPKALVDAKGDIVVATGSDAPARLPVGANTQALLADSSQPTGLKWGVAGAALTYEGDHVGATSYDDGDIVVKDGIAYLCVGGPTTQAPNPVPWGPAGMMGGYIKTTDRGVANGVASLDASALVPKAQLGAVQTLTGGGYLLGGGTPLAGTTADIKFQILGSICFFWGSITLGADGGAGLYEVALPPAAPAVLASQRVGVMTGYDSSAGAYALAAAVISSSTRMIFQYPSIYPVGTVVNTGASAPWVWASGDVINWGGHYQIA